jgi:hypothetical protein
VELAVRSVSQVGNYDYLIGWVFTQDGNVRAEIGLTGIDAPKAQGDHSADENGDSSSLRITSHHFSFRPLPMANGGCGEAGPEYQPIGRASASSGASLLAQTWEAVH